ncbi:MAG: hypothetical protein ACKVX7_17465 [Planctomycetota bacterium]
MADEVKPLNRDKPFQRINNEAFIVKASPDALGRECGCHVPEEFDEFDKEFLEFITDKIPAVRVIRDVIEVMRKIARAVATAARIAAIVTAIIGFISLMFGGPATPPGILAAAAAVAAAAAITAAIIKAIDDVIEIISDVLKTFFGILGRRILKRAIRVFPQWVPVLRRASSARITVDQIVEIEGVCTRSYGNPVDVPFINWHFWFNWSCHIQPEPRYSRVAAPVSNPPDATDLEAGERPIARDGSVEVQWDQGALWASQQPFLDGFPEQGIDVNDAPFFIDDWCWPMTGSFVWASGRWVYDCSRASRGRATLMSAMINPPRAIASARFEAVEFDENGPGVAVPAIQFMFFACKRGGYMSYDTINDEDYEFILDLPPVEMRSEPYPIGHTPDFPANTIFLRPRLLMKLRPLTGAGSIAIEPIVELIRPDDPKKAPTQARIKIPLKAAPKAEAAGFILSLGWHDPARVEAQKVKRCRVRVLSFEPKVERDSPAKKLREIFKKEEDGLKAEIKKRVGDIKIIDLDLGPLGNVTIRLKDVPLLGALIQDMVAAAFTAFIDGLVGLLPVESEEWLLRIGVNGRWKTHYFDPVSLKVFDFRNPAVISPEQADKFIFDFKLAPNDQLFVTSSGIEFDPVGDMMRAPFAKRLLEHPDRDNSAMLWREIVSPHPDEQEAKRIRRAAVFQYVFKVMTDTTAGGISKIALGFENQPLGILDPDPTTRGFTPQSNPIVIRDNFPESTIRRTTPFARAAGEQMVLVEKVSTADYVLTYTVEVKGQFER